MTKTRTSSVRASEGLTKHAIAKIALGLGLDAIETDPRWFEKARKAK